MATALELKRMELELMKVSTARHEQEYRILEFQENIDRLKPQVDIQRAKENELIEKIKEAKENKA